MIPSNARVTSGVMSSPSGKCRLTRIRKKAGDKGEGQGMRNAKYRMATGMPALVLYLGMVACSGETQANAEGASEAVELSAEAAEPAISEGGEEHSGSEGGGEHVEGDEHAEGGEHGGLTEGGEHGSEGEGEESGVYIGSGETWDASRNGVSLVLSLDLAANAFVGFVENTTPNRVCGVRVEVHVSTGVELGPTERTDLDPEERRAVRVQTSSEAFDAWTAHPELSPCGGS